MENEPFLLGVDGGGTRCRARLCDFSGAILGEGEAGPANIRFGVEESFAAVMDAAAQAFAEAGLAPGDCATVACIALAGAGDPVIFSELESHKHPFRRAIFATDSHAACAGAHRGQDGGVVIVGTGSIGEAIVERPAPSRWRLGLSGVRRRQRRLARLRADAARFVGL